MNKLYHIEGMTCASCTALIEKEVIKLDGVASIAVNFATEKATLEIDSKVFHEESFLQLLLSLGYRGYNSAPSNERKISQNRMAIIEFVSLLLVGSSFMFGMFNMNLLPFNHAFFNLIQLILSTFIWAFYAKFYFYNLKNCIIKFHSNMHTLIGLGIVANISYSYYQFFHDPHAHLFIEGVPFILGFTKMGHYFEQMAKTKGLKSLSGLYKSQIKFANVVMENKIQNTPVLELKIDDVIRIKPGEKIPVNGKVIKGYSHVNESLITGESVAVAKTIDDLVIAGAINIEGTIDLSVQSLFHDSAVADIIKFVELAETKKTNIAKVADTVVYYFVPMVILIAFLTFFIWWGIGSNLDNAFKHFIAVLIIACPCALGLAAPICTMITTRNLSEQGVLIQNGEVLEKGARIDTVVFDKTGTLTMGKPIINQWKLFSDPNLSEEQILSYILSASLLSTHPLSMALVNFLQIKKSHELEPDRFKNIPGFGLSAEFGESNILIGSKELLISNEIKINSASLNENIGSLVYVGLNKKHVATFVISDEIKPTAKELIVNLKKLNLAVWMLTGDHQLVANSVAENLGIENIKANMKPHEKADFISQLRLKNKNVLMVGDGINDAIALSQANVSMAMAQGADVALASSEVSILDNNLDLVHFFILTSQKTVKIIKQNLFFSFIYNIFCIPLAAGLFLVINGVDLDPKWASISMGLSSVSVILNALRLNRKII